MRGCWANSSCGDGSRPQAGWRRPRWPRRSWQWSSCKDPPGAHGRPDRGRACKPGVRPVASPHRSEDAMTTGYARHDAVAVITLDNPPVNGMNHAVRRAVVEGIDRAHADRAISAVVLTGAGGLFSGGADIREFGTPQARAEPTLPTVIAIVEASDKPVVAAISGSCMGGGLELALGCHFRVATADAQFALPEVRLGLLPG